MAVAGKKKQKKSRRKWGLLALLLLLLGVSGGGFGLNFLRGPQLEGTKQETQLLPDFDPATIIALTLERPPQAPVEITRGDSGHWQIDAPSPFPADDVVVEDLLLRLQRAEALPVKPITSAADLTGVGLDAPKLRVKLKTASAQAAEIEIGGEAVGSEGSFARRVETVPSSMGRIVILPAALVAALSSEVEALRSHRLFRVDPSSVTAVQVLGPDYTTLLVRKGADWQLQEPIAGAADRPRAQELVMELIRAQAENFLSTDPGPQITGVDQPEVRVRLGQEGDAWTSWLDVGRPPEPGTHYARMDGELLTLKSTLVRELLRDPARFRDRDLLDLPYDKVVSLSVRGAAGHESKLERGEGGNWTLELVGSQGSRKFDAENAEVTSFLQRLDQLEIEEFETRAAVAAPGSELAGIAVELGFQAGEPMRLRVEAPAEGELRCGVMLPSDPTTTHRVDARLLETLLDLELAFRSRLPWAAPSVLPEAGGDWELEIEQHPADGEPRHYRLTKGAGADWQSVAGGATDSAAVNALCLELLHLKARGLVEHWDGSSRPREALPGAGFLAKVRLLQIGDADAASWSLVLHGQAITHSPLYVGTSEGFDLVMLIGDQTALRILSRLE